MQGLAPGRFAREAADGAIAGHLILPSAVGFLVDCGLGFDQRHTNGEERALAFFDCRTIGTKPLLVAKAGKNRDSDT